MVILDDINITEEEIEIIKKLVENHKYHNVRKTVLIMRNIYTGEITIENQKTYSEDNGALRFTRAKDEELLWWYERFDWDLNGRNDKEMAEEVAESLRKLTDGTEIKHDIAVELAIAKKRAANEKK